MAVAARHPTADDLFQRVESLLRREQGAKKLKQLNQLVVRVVNNLPTLREMRAHLRQRASMQLYVNLSSAKELASRGRVRLSVRVHGIECGTVTVAADGTRSFAPSNRGLFGRCGFDDATRQKWSSPAVAKYIKAAEAIAAKGKGRPEADVESALILQMKRTRGEWRGEQQPVCLAGLPLQLPTPVSASGANPVPRVGHIDVLARLGRGGKKLRVYELKAPNAGASRALDQAVAYVAALRFVLAQKDEAVKAWWALIGFSAPPRRMPDFEAFAFVADTLKNIEAVDAAIERLNFANAHSVVLGAMYYQRSPSGRLEIRVR
jgi:hypothetical protein